MASDKFTPIMYADDTTLLSTLDDFNGNQITNPNSIQINAKLTKVMDWLTVNKLSLNIKKKMMIFCSKQRILKPTEIPSVIINHMGHSMSNQQMVSTDPSDSFEIWNTCRNCLETNIRQKKCI